MAELKAVWFHQEAPDSKSCESFPDVSVDFNGILPMPKSLDVTSGSTSSRAVEWLSIQDAWLLSGPEVGRFWIMSKLKEQTSELLDWQTDTVGRLKAVVAENPGLLEKIGLDCRYIEQIERNITAYGCPTWYEWCNSHWGTKWNAYSQHLSDWSETSFSITFDTAWSSPEPVFAALADAFPDVEIVVRYIDEGGGFAGTFTASDGLLEDFPCWDGDFQAFAEEHFGWSFDDEDE